MIGQVIKLDRGFPLVLAEDGREYRCEHATSLVKEEADRAVIGDKVEIEVPYEHDKGIIEKILPRTNKFIRKDPTERAVAQVLAANFDTVMIVQPANDINIKLLERELVLAHETGAQVVVVLAKVDLLDRPEEGERISAEVQQHIGEEELILVSAVTGTGMARVRELVPRKKTAVLIGKSGVGKSSLVNMLVGEELQDTTEVRSGDGKGRHTTVSREMIALPEGGFIIDMPGVRGLGLWDAEEGIGAAFTDIEELAQSCRFGDCKHESEPGCAVQKAAEEGTLSVDRLESYQALKNESRDIHKRRDEAKRIQTRKGHPRHRS